MRSALPFAATVWLVATTGCSGSSDGDEAAGGGSGGGGGTVTPPANIDVTSCASIVDPSGSNPACASCCQSAGFTASSFINDDHCTCGNARDDGRATVCAAPDLALTPNTCGDCCAAAGFLGSSWQGGGVATDSICVCANKRDAAVCQSTPSAPDASDACGRCCLQNGFLASTFTTLGGGECACLAP